MPTLGENTMPDIKIHGKKKIAVAMSGGVDSSMVAYLLAEQGHELIGFTAWTLNGPGKCCNDALVNAGRVCEELGIPYDTVDLRAEFTHYVMNYYNNSYKAGLTPNPCVECNRYVKWEALIDYAIKKWDVDYVATGHYCRIDRSGKTPKLLRAVDERKDQTYMMTRVYPKDLERALFPLGDLTKPQVVEKAQAMDIPTAFSKESQDICFVLDGQAKYMDGVFGKQTGDIIDYDTGKKLGEHDGYYRYTLGQRKGVGVAAGRPVYVVKIDPENNIVYLGDEDHIKITQFTVLEPNWLIAMEAFPLRSMVKIRYNSPPTLATVEKHPEKDNALIVTLDEPVVAITPGQIAAFYDTDFNELYGGGFIEDRLIHQPFDREALGELPDLHCQITPA